MDPLPFVSSSKGFIALTNVIILGALGAFIAVTLLLMGITATRTSATIIQSAAARAAANACAESALLKIKTTGSLTDSDNLNFGDNSCNYTTAPQPDGSGVLTTSGMAGTVVRKVQIVITTTSPAIVIGSWQEVADF